MLIKQRKEKHSRIISSLSLYLYILTLMFIHSTPLLVTQIPPYTAFSLMSSSLIRLMVTRVHHVFLPSLLPYFLTKYNLLCVCVCV